jgi:hypothetical protein
VVLVLLGLPAFAQLDPTIADRYEIFTMHWTGSIASGNSFTIAIPDTTSSGKFVYPIGCTVHADAAVTVTVRYGSTTAPTTATQAPVAVNSSQTPVFSYYPTSDATGGSIITSTPVAANVPTFISLTGVRFNKGRGGSGIQYRNITFTISSASGTTYNTCVVGQRQ